jgi:hypothetical protein
MRVLPASAIGRGAWPAWMAGEADYEVERFPGGFAHVSELAASGEHTAELYFWPQTLGLVVHHPHLGKPQALACSLGFPGPAIQRGASRTGRYGEHITPPQAIPSLNHRM